MSRGAAPISGWGERALVLWLGALYVAGAFLAAVVALKAPVFDPRDEIGHYDYVDALTDGRLPLPADPISDTTLSLCRVLDWSRPPGWDGTRAGMGIAGRSYEAQQPPLYYMLLTPLNAALRGRVAPIVQVRLLRLFSLTFVVWGGLLLLRAGRVLATYVDGAGVAVALAAPPLVLANASSWATLGNDSLSVLFGGLVFLLTVRLSVEPFQVARLAGLSAAVGAAVLTKPTNLPLVMIPVALGAVELADRRSTREVARCLAPLLVVPCYFGVRLLLRAEPLGSGADLYFSGWVKGAPGPAAYAQSLLAESLNLSHVLLWAPPLAAWILAALMAVGAGAAMRIGVSPPARRLLLLCPAVVVVVLVAGALLNERRPGVHWHAFRQWAGFAAFWYVAPFTWLAALPRRAALAVGGIVSLGLTAVAWRVGSVLLR